MNKIKEKFTNLETYYKWAQIMHIEEQYKAIRMTERIRILKKEMILNEPLGQPKEQL